MGYSRRQSILRLLPVALPVGGLFAAGAAVTLLQSFGHLVPLANLEIGASAWIHLLSDRWNWFSILHTIVVATASAGIAVILGTVLSWLIHRLPGIWRQLSTVYKIPLILPHLTIAYAAIMLFSQSGFFSALSQRLGLIDSIDQFPNLLYSGHGFGVILAYVMKGTSFVILMNIGLLKKLDENLLSNARMLGASGIAIFRDIVLPHLRPAILSSFAILSFFAIGAIEVPWLIGESRPQMLSVTAYNLYFHSDLSQRPQAAALLTLLMGISFFLIYLYFRLNRVRRT